MKKNILLAFLTGAVFPYISQVNWQKGGNSISGGTNSSFGTNSTWNAPIFFQSFGLNRMKLNGTVNYTVNGFAGDRSGYLLLGATSADNYSNPNKGAASLLHLNGRYNTGVQPVIGYRPWMQTRITMTDNDDLSYFGLRKWNLKLKNV